MIRIRDHRTSRNPERDQSILALRRSGLTLREVAKTFNLSWERVRQIEARETRVRRMAWLALDDPVEVLVNRQGMHVWVLSRIERIYSWGVVARDEMGRLDHFYERDVRPVDVIEAVK